MYAPPATTGQNERMLVSRAAAAGAVLTVAVLSWSFRDATVAAPGWLVAPALTVAVAAVADAATARRRRTHMLVEQTHLLERERAAAARTAVDLERARIARELHDVVSHTVSVMVIQAGAARRAFADSPSESLQAMAAVETSGREAMTELRRMLDLLAPAADGSDELDLVPQPGLDRLEALVDRIAFAGLPVEVRVDGEPRPLPPGLDLTAYRIIQEALTNALRHAPKSKAEVNVRYAERYLRLEILNSGPSVLTGGTHQPAPSERIGRGLLGLRERVTIYGGELEARRRLGGGYRVRARIPLEQP
jgi:signal transduction histidine kinase